MRTHAPCVIRALWFSGLLFCVGVPSSQGQPINTGIRVVSPQAGATFEPGAPVTVVVEPEGPTPFREVVIIAKGVGQRALASPFQFTFPAPQELGPKQFGVFAQDQRRKEFLLELTYHVETATPVTSLQVRSSTVGQPPSVDLIAGVLEERIRVDGTFADGATRDISKSREIQYISSSPQVATVTADGLVEAVDPGTTTITVTYKGTSVTVPVTVKFKKLSVPVDIEPGERRKAINLDSGGHVRVAILSTPAFAASTVNARTVKFGPGGAAPELEHQQTEDVNGDGRADLVLRFRIRDAGLQCGESTATLTGRTVHGDQISGTDTIHVVGKACR